MKIEKLTETISKILFLKEDINQRLSAAKSQLKKLQDLPLKTPDVLKKISVAQKSVDYLTKQKEIILAAAKRAQFIKRGKIGLAVAGGTAAVAGAVALKKRKSKQKTNTEDNKMYKTKLQDLITEKYFNDEIDQDRFYRMSERIEKISEKRAEEIFNEQPSGALLAAGVIAYASIIAALVAAHDRFFTYYGKKCFGLKSSQERRLCKYSAKIEAATHELQLTKSMIKSHCPKTKNPSKCKLNLEDRIEKLEMEIKRLENLRKENKIDFSAILATKRTHPSERGTHEI